LIVVCLVLNKKGLPLFYKSRHPKKKQTAKRILQQTIEILVAVNKTFFRWDLEIPFFEPSIDSFAKTAVF